jgi:ABC-type nitrate/sulfonate/bicarbonate transport system substrate-binding protein
MISLLKIFLFFVLLMARVQANATSPVELRVQLPWLHNAQFTGLYVAEFRKHFEKEGIKTATTKLCCHQIRF